MCGIVGFLDKRGGQEQPIGRTLLSMLQALSCRGPDSAGVAVFHSQPEWHARVSAPPSVDPDRAVTAFREAGLAVFRDYRNGVYDALLPAGVDVSALEAALQRSLPGTEVICLGQRLYLAKQVGSPEQLETTYQISKITGTH